jgi:protein phosphatase
MIEIGFKSDKGLKRKNNEDAFFVMPEESIFMVADGVGGNNAGEVASRTTVSKIVEYIRGNPVRNIKSSQEVSAYFLKCLSKVNKSIYDLSAYQPENAGMATTVTIVCIAFGYAHVINVGDSRAYFFRDGSLTQITEDHTYVNELIREGVITKEEAQFHEKKNVITKAIGGEEDTSPDFFCQKLKQGDVIILCTDGLHGEIGDENIRLGVMSGGNMPDVCSDLVNKANQCGGRDNITVICLKI